ncbi:MAG: tryptophan synthase subunit alpha [Phycisphaerales bacterium]|jgi:tryptophan synthase alpha chain|nr:tryptophan synthase subunit alpha [Phycisphaerales bacterium]
MSRIDDIFTTLRAAHKRALMPFVVGGYPGLDATEMVIAGLEDAGAAMAEIGFPFSDPIADGPVIAAAMHDTLENGTTIDTLLATVERVRPRTEAGLIAMVSESIVHRRGGGRFIQQLADVGFDGLIIPDSDHAAADELLPTIDACDLAFAMLVAPTTTPQRLPELIARCRGFVYLLAQTGLTGARAELPDLTERVAAIRALTDLPIAAGFGISTPDQVAAATATCDAAIVGSALVDRMSPGNNAPEQAPPAAALAFIDMLSNGLPTG